MAQVRRNDEGGDGGPGHQIIAGAATPVRANPPRLSGITAIDRAPELTACLSSVHPKRVLDRGEVHYAKNRSGDLLMALMSPCGALTTDTREMA